MSGGSRFQVVHPGDGWALARWTCAGHDPPGRAATEAAGSAEIVLPVRGCFLRVRDGEEVLATPNVALLADRGDEYRVRHPVAGGDVCAVLLLGDGALEDLARAGGGVGGRSTPRFSRYVAPVPAGAHLAAARLVAPGAGEIRDPPALEGVVADLVLALAGAGRTRPVTGRRATTRRRHLRAVAEAAGFMAARFRDPISIGDVARAASYSPFHFARVFRRHAGTSPHRYLLRLRLRRAASEILDGEDDLSALAHRVGFSSHSHMTSAFRSEYGASPSAVRAGFRKRVRGPLP